MLCFLRSSGQVHQVLVLPEQCVDEMGLPSSDQDRSEPFSCIALDALICGIRPGGVPVKSHDRELVSAHDECFIDEVEAGNLGPSAN